MFLKDQYDAHIQGKSHAKKIRTSEARDSLKETSTPSPETASTASSSTLATSEPDLASSQETALSRLASNSELRAALKEAEYFCHVCHVHCTSKILGLDLLKISS